MSIGKTTMKYQPYLFAVSVAGLIVKLAHSTVSNTPVFDKTLVAILIVFLVSSVLYFSGRIRSSRGSTISVKLNTSDVKNSDVTGAVAGKRDHTDIQIEMGKATDSKVVGFEERK